jgi:hypothetical protein
METMMESTVELLSNLEGNAKWISANYERLKKHYKNQWIAVLNKSVTDHDTDFNELVKRLKSRFPQKYNEIALEYITNEELNLIL